MNRNIKCFLRLLLLSQCIYCFQINASEFHQVVTKIKPSIVGIATVLSTRRPPTLLRGTGFVVKDGHHVITNSHVLPEALDLAKREYLAVLVGQGEDSEVRTATLVAEDKKHDLALLRMDGPRVSPMSVNARREIREGQFFAFTGFPIGAVLGLYPVTHQSMISAITPIVIPAASSSQLSAKLIKRMRNKFNVYQLDAIAYPGNSGSPLYDMQTGEVIAVLNMVFVKGSKEHALTTPSGISYAIPARYVEELFQHAKL